MQHKVIILADSSLRYIQVQDLAKVYSPHRATLNTLIRGIQRDWFTNDWNQYELAIIHCGTNDVEKGNQRHILPLIQFIIREIRQRNGRMKFIVSAILPRPIDFKKTNPIITRVNQVIKVWSENHAVVHFLPSYRTFIRHKQIRSPHMFDDDSLHLSNEGINRMTTIIRNAIHLYNQGRLTL
jgi:lysophospholipase L1-like esterase